MADTPSFEVCKRLAAAGWPQDPNGPTRASWFENRAVEGVEPWVDDHSGLNVGSAQDFWNN